MVNTRISLANKHEGNLGAIEHLFEIKAPIDEMAIFAIFLSNEEIVSCVPIDIDLEYYQLVSGVVAWEAPITLSMLHTQLISLEARINLLKCGHMQQLCVKSTFRGRRADKHSHGNFPNNVGND